MDLTDSGGGRARTTASARATAGGHNDNEPVAVDADAMVYREPLTGGCFSLAALPPALAAGFLAPLPLSSRVR